jgi:hypothetical protein
MPVTYTNRKGVTYYLCRGITKTGKPRYYFARETKGEPVDEIPEGFKISESVNGIVSLAKERPSQILPGEIASVEASVERHPKAHNYRVAVKHERIEIYERVGPDVDDLIARPSGMSGLLAAQADQLRELQDRYGQFTPVLRFILADAERRTFRVERWCYLGSIDDWINVGTMGPVGEVAREWVPRLGTDRLFAVYY